MGRRNPLRCLAFRRFAQLDEAEFDDDLFILGEFHPLDEAHQQLPVLPGSFDEALYQFLGSVLTADGALFPKLQFLPLFLQLFPL